MGNRSLARFFARTVLYDEFTALAYRVRRYQAHRSNHPER